MTNKVILKDMKRYTELEGGVDRSILAYAQQGLRMKAALEMVLLCYSGAWTTQKEKDWVQLQKDAGIESPINDYMRDSVLCSTIRSVLGEA